MRTYIEIGKIVNTHGVNGTVKIEPWCDSPKVLCQMKKLYFSDNHADEKFFSREVIKASIQKEWVLVTFADIGTIESAIPLKNTTVYAHRDDIPLAEGAWLVDDLIGMPVTDASTKESYGTLHDVINGAAGDLYEIRKPSGKMVLVPAVPAFIAGIDRENGILLTPIEGLLDED